MPRRIFPARGTIPFPPSPSHRRIAALQTVIYHCKSGGRTRMASSALSRCSAADSYIMDGGIEAWKAAGYPVKRG